MFKLTPDQEKQLYKWQDEQNAKKEHLPCNGGVYTYEFTPTTLGLVVVVKNNLTKEEINLTNYDEW